VPGKPEVRIQESEVRSQKSGVRIQKPEVPSEIKKRPFTGQAGQAGVRRKRGGADIGFGFLFSLAGTPTVYPRTPSYKQPLLGKTFSFKGALPVC